MSTTVTDDACLLPCLCAAQANALSCPAEELVDDPEDAADVVVQGEEEDLLRLSDYDHPTDETAAAKGEEGGG